MMSAKRGFFITFEGPEGSGKSSQAKELAGYLRKTGFKVITCSDPGSTSLGKKLRRVLLHERLKLSPIQEAMLFIAGRISLVEEFIKPALRSGRIVICDRFHDSTIAYQGFAGRLDVAWLDEIARKAIGNIMPHLTLFLNVPVSVGMGRLRGKKDRMESKAVEFHKKVHRGFLEIARRNKKRIVIIDASKSKAAIRNEVCCIVMKRLGYKKAAVC